MNIQEIYKKFSFTVVGGLFLSTQLLSFTQAASIATDMRDFDQQSTCSTLACAKPERSWTEFATFASGVITETFKVTCAAAEGLALYSLFEKYGGGNLRPNFAKFGINPKSHGFNPLSFSLLKGKARIIIPALAGVGSYLLFYHPFSVSSLPIQIFSGYLATHLYFPRIERDRKVFDANEIRKIASWLDDEDNPFSLRAATELATSSGFKGLFSSIARLNYISYKRSIPIPFTFSKGQNSHGDILPPIKDYGIYNRRYSWLENCVLQFFLNNNFYSYFVDVTINSEKAFLIDHRTIRNGRLCTDIQPTYDTSGSLFQDPADHNISPENLFYKMILYNKKEELKIFFNNLRYKWRDTHIVEYIKNGAIELKYNGCSGSGLFTIDSFRERIFDGLAEHPLTPSPYSYLALKTQIFLAGYAIGVLVDAHWGLALNYVYSTTLPYASVFVAGIRAFLGV